MARTGVRTVVEGLTFGESPRWHKGALWFSDIPSHRVMRTNMSGGTETAVEIADDVPSGLGWLPGGALLVVAMETQRLLRVEVDGSVVEHADLSSVARGSLNDMVVAPDGTAYVGDAGIRIQAPDANWGSPPMGQTLRVATDGTVSCAADDLLFPNGHVLSEDERTLIVAESFAKRLTAFDVEADGVLSNRRTFAELQADNGAATVFPDGICFDREHGVWVADVVGRRVIRVLEGGQITESITYDDAAPMACALGGEHRRTLFVCVGGELRHEVSANGDAARIEACEVDVPGAGRP
jgi:sugar lactone lactonase YvrE